MQGTCFLSISVGEVFRPTLPLAVRSVRSEKPCATKRPARLFSMRPDLRDLGMM